MKPPPFMSTDSETRKLMPVASGVLAYFPDALMCVAWISRVGNEKHNAGEPLHWAKEKSSDEPDAEVRHLLDHVRGLPPDPGLEDLGRVGHLASKAWRALAHLQRACDQVRAEHAAPIADDLDELDDAAPIPYACCDGFGGQRLVVDAAGNLVGYLAEIELEPPSGAV